MGNENGYKDYMEGGYDENITKKSVQVLQDSQRAARLAQHAEVRMESAWMAERQRIATETGERGATLDAIMNQYLEEDKYQQYLVDGAILRCENATLDDFELPNGEKVILEEVADQSDTERINIRLCVSENIKDDESESIKEGSISITGHTYATVKDTIKGKNIIPPCCNCKVAVNRDKEVERIMADSERNKQGVCKHLMQLNDEWRNLWKQGQSYLSKTNRVPTTMSVGFGEIGAGNYLSEKIMGEPETVQGITMTSMLFCKHGGIIMPVTSGQEVTYFQFTLRDLYECGWKKATIKDMEKLNQAMTDYNVTTKDSAVMMLATILAESGNCEWAREGDNTEYKLDHGEQWDAYIADLKAKGNKVGDYKWWERGVGYIQVTGKKAQEDFLVAIQIDKSSIKDEERVNYIAKDYAIEISVWYWTHVAKSDQGNLNAYLEAYGASDEIFLITQYFVNGYGDDAALQAIRKGEVTYDTDITTKELIVHWASGDKRYELPNGWEDRYIYWETVRDYFYGK